MIENLDDLFSESANVMKRSIIRELLKLTNKPGLISFAGGLPGPELFPVELIKKMSAHVLDTYPGSALQYSATEGIAPLREALVEHMKQTSPCDFSVDNLIITTGSQQSLDLIAKVFINPGDTIVTGAPTYLGCLGAVKPYRPKVETTPLDEKGMIPEELEKTLDRLAAKDVKPKFIYVVPSYQNPMGVTLPEERRKRIAEIAVERDLIIIEDSPYREVKYVEEHYNDIYYYAPNNTVFTSTFSKILAPGFRLAWLLAPIPILDKIVMAKQGADLCTAAFPQYIAYEYIKGGHLETHLATIKAGYGKKRTAMLEAMEKYFPKEVHWTEPTGGMFLWATLPEGCDTVRMFDKAIAKNVAYVIGNAFFVHEHDGLNTMRLNFTHATAEEITIGVQHLADVIREEMQISGCAE